MSKQDCIRMLLFLYMVREFEDRLQDLEQKGLTYGPVHTSQGQEAIAAAAAVVLHTSDIICTSHRPHGTFLAKALMYYAPDGYQPLRDGVSARMQSALERTFAEVLGLADGWCGGRGGSMHLCDPESGEQWYCRRQYPHGRGRCLGPAPSQERECGGLVFRRRGV
jgi:2-oxoisovalerate dehydrogenase E1 component